MATPILRAVDLMWQNFFSIPGGDNLYRVTAVLIGGKTEAKLICRHDDSNKNNITLEPDNPVVRLSRTEALNIHGKHPGWIGGH